MKNVIWLFSVVFKLKLVYDAIYSKKKWSWVTKEELSWLICWRQHGLHEILCRVGTNPLNHVVGILDPFFKNIYKG